MVLEYSLSNIQSITREIMDRCRQSKIFCLEGQMGAGKTRLIEEICHTLGSRDECSSPTFSIINEYALGGESIYHMDLYRLKTLREAEQLGLEEYFYSGAYCFIEWYQITEKLVPRPYYHILIAVLDENYRQIHIHLVH